MKNNNVIFIMANETREEFGTVYRVDLTTGEFFDELDSIGYIFYPEYFNYYHIISEAQYEEILKTQQRARQTDKNYIKQYLRELILDVANTSKMMFEQGEVEQPIVNEDKYIYLIGNEKGDYGFIYKFNIETGILIDEFSSFRGEFTQEIAETLNPISKKQYDDIMKIYEEWHEKETDDIQEKLQNELARVVELSNQFKF